MAQEGEEQLRFSFDRPNPDNALRVLRRELLLHPRDKILATGILSRLRDSGADIEGIARRIAEGTLETDKILAHEPPKKQEAYKGATAQLVGLVKYGVSYHYASAQKKGKLDVVALELNTGVKDAGAREMMVQNAQAKAGIILLRLGITPRRAIDEPGAVREIIVRIGEQRKNGLTTILHQFARHDVENGTLYEYLTKGLRNPGE